MNDTRVQRANELLDHSIDWADWLQEGEQITVSNWSVNAPSGQTLLGAPMNTFTSTSVFVNGGVAGELVELHNTIGTNQGRIGERELWIRFLP